MKGTTMKKALLIAAVAWLAACTPDAPGGEPPCTEQDCQSQPDPALD